MAVQQNRSTRSSRGKRRSHNSLKLINLSTDKKSKEKHLRHHITNTGFYCGRKIITK